jgi:hypothetical protein
MAAEQQVGDPIAAQAANPIAAQAADPIADKVAVPTAVAQAVLPIAVQAAPAKAVEPIGALVDHYKATVDQVVASHKHLQTQHTSPSHQTSISHLLSPV